MDNSVTIMKAEDHGLGGARENQAGRRGVQASARTDPPERKGSAVSSSPHYRDSFGDGVAWVAALGCLGPCLEQSCL